MADFFIDKEELEKNNQSSRDFWQAQNKQVQAKKEEYQENLDRYTVNIPQEEYEIINQTISNAENPEEESYRWASAFELQRQYGIPLQEGYQNLENINAALWGDKYTFTPKTAFKAIVDSGHLGINTVKQAGIGTQVMARELRGENVDDLLTQWEEIEKENESLYDYMDRNFAIEALKFGAQSLPFTGYVAGAGILGSLIAPGVGTAAGFTASMQQAAGLQYMQLRQAGATKANAFAFSLIDGALEAIVETSLGNVAGAMGQSALGAAGKQAALEKITANVFKRLHYNGTVKNLALKLGTEYIKENFEEGMEEVIQDLINNGTQALAAELGSYNIDGRTAQQAAKDAWENFYGGFAGSLVLGLPTSALKVRSDIKEHKKIRNLAETTPSGEMFKEAVKNSPIFEGMEEGEKLEAINTIHKNGQAYAEEELNLRAKEYGEVLGTAENFEEENIDEETGDKIIEPEYRNSETGLLHSQNVVVSEDDGIVSGVLGVGDPTRENKNTYAEFKYTLDENNNKVTIDELKVGKTRLGLKEEIYDTFARNFPGMDIEWNAIGKVAQEWKQQFEQANPQGAKAGLKYYNSTNDIADAKTRTEVVKQMKEAYKKVGRQLTGEQAAANVAIMESLYRRLREQQDFRDRGIDTFSKYVSYTFGENIFGEGSIAEEAAQQKYGDTVRAQGGSIQRSLQDLDRDLKAIIYVTKNGDFSTFSHEMAHIARKQLTGDLLKQVEDAIGVTEGNWTRELEEKFAYGFEQFLREGKVENEALRPFYEKVAQFLVDCLTRLKNVIEMTPDIEKTYNELLSKGDNSTLAAAQKAVANEEKAHQAAELQRQRQAETQKQQEEDQKNAAAQEQAEEESEVIFDEEEAPEEEKENTTEEQDADWIDEDIRSLFTANSNLTSAAKEEIKETLNSPEASIQEKTQAADEAAESSYDDLPIFQLIGELGATNLDRVEEVTTRMDNLEVAKEMFKAGKTVERIRLATGWEMGADAQWRYEIMDGKFKNIHEANLISDADNFKMLKLSELFDAPELYRAYPELRNMYVYFDTHIDQDFAGTYSAATDSINFPLKSYETLLDNIGIEEDEITGEQTVITEGAADYLRGVLVHEIQHAIQQRENFARGSNKNVLRENPEVTELTKALASYSGYTKEELEGFTAEKTRQQFLDMGITEEELAQWSKDIDGLGTIEEIIERDIRDHGVDWTYDEIQSAKQLADRAGKVEIQGNVYSSPYEAYRAAAGEVEARNVQRRLNMSAIQRLNTLLLDTEDIDRNEQWVYRTAVEMAAEEVEKTEAERQEEAVREQYENTDKWLKAPNGKDSNLTEKQWLQIRTDNFKRWFGDWENDPTNASKVVDENGEPKVVYHGSGKWFTEFNNGEQIQHSQAPANTIFTTSDRDIAMSFANYYGAKQKDVILDKDSPLHRRYDWGVYREGGIYSLFLNMKNPKTVDFNNKQWNDPGLNINEETQKAINEGYDGLIATNIIDVGFTDVIPPATTDYIVFKNTDVKSATNNSGEFSPYNPSILFQGGDPTLYGVHNLSEDSLKRVFKMGGLANPSLAVMDKDLGVHTNFGAISLIAYNSLINKSTGKNSGTYGADVYSPRYPNITKTVTETGRKKLKSIFWAIEDENLRDHFVENTAQTFENERKPSFEYSKLPIAYLAEKGNKDFWQYEQSKYSDEDKKRVEALGPTADPEGKTEAPVLLDIYSKELKGTLEQDIAEEKEELKRDDLTKSQRNILEDKLAIHEHRLQLAEETIQDSIDPETGFLHYGIANDLLYKIRKEIRNAGKIDEYATERKARELVEFDQDFKKWAEEKYNSVEMDEKIFNGFTPSGNRRYLAHTLENVSKFMKQEGVRGGEGINYGMGSARAMVTPKFSTLKQIRDNKDRLTDSETFKKIKDELKEEYYWVTELLQGSLDDYDAGDARFIESIEKGYFDADYIRREYKDVKMTDDDAQRIAEFVQAMKEMPTEYFETKFERPIYTEDFGTSFAAAVLPETTDPAVISKLEEQGLLIFKYKNEQDREAVIKNALESANKIRQILFQTQEELYGDARTFSTWQEFMDFYETMGRPEVSPIPYDADAQWYQTTWELANKVTPEESINRSILDERYEKEGTVPTALDALFVAEIVEDDGALLDYLRTLATYDSIDLNSEEYAQVADAEEAADRERISQLQDYMKTIMYSRSWKQAMASLKAGNDPTPTDFRTIRGEMRDDFKSRDFRALYAEVTGDEKYAVAEKDKPANIMQERYAKHPERYFDIVKVDDDFTKYSPEKRKQISKAMDNADLAAKIRSGKLKMNDEVYNYIKSLDHKIKSLQKELTEQEIEAENDYKRIADAERRELLKLHDKMLIAKSKYNGTNDEITRKMNKGIRITSKYTREGQNLKANYDELFRKFSDLKNMILVDAQVEAALKRQEQIHQIKEEIGTKQQEKSRAAEEKKLRIQLVKRTMRRIDFTKIDYEDAKTIVAIQRLFEPNLLGGVNRWIGTEGPFLRGVISGILTDVEYKEQIEKYLRNNAKSSQAYMDFVKLLSETKSIEDFNKWTQKDRKAALRYLPKENWVRDLNLLKLAKEREESIDLDISTVEKQRPVYDEKTGEPKTYVGPDGEKHQATQTTFVLSYSDEIAQRVKDAIGADMFENLINVPFAEWTFEQLEELATRINGLYKQGRDQLEGKKLARKEAADAIRRNIENTVKNTGIIINDDDDDETKQRKLEKINKILGLTGSNTKGSDTSKDTGFKARMNRLLHSYNDANVLRVARILDGYDESTNVMELYRKEDNCYIVKTRSMNERAARINQVMEDNNITAADLATVIKVTVPSYDTVNPTVTQEYTIDDLLYFAAAAEDYELKDNGSYDDFAACSRNAVMYGNMFASAADLAAKQTVNDNEEVDELGNSVGLKQYIARCNARFDKVLEAAKALDPKYQVLAKAIAEDYAAQYDRMNKVSVEQFNQPVHRVKCYVPLNRLESNGDTNINKVREDLLAAMGANAFKQGVNKGMTARRVRINPLNQKPVVTGLYKTWADSVERTEHFIAYSEYVNELNRVYKSRDANFTRQFIENRYGKGMIRYIDDYINEVANPNANKVREAGAELLHTLRGRTAPAYLAWKASAIVKQGLTSPWPFMQYINPAEYLSASWKAITSKGEIYKAIRQKSVYMNNRVMDPMNDLIDEMAEYGKTKFDRFMGKQAQKGMAGLEWIDWVCVAPGWYAAYQKEYNRLCGTNEAVYQAAKERLQEENMYAEVGTSEWKTAEQIEALAQKAQQDDVETRAVQYADDITRACQPSNRAVDIAPLFKNSSEAMKAYLQFQTSLNVIWQNIKYDINYVAKKPDAVAKEQFFQITGIILGYALAGIFMNSVMDGLGGDDDKDGEKADDRLKNLVYYATTQFTDAVPMIGSELTNTMDRLITGKASYQNSGTDMTPTATKLFAILTNAKAGNWEKAAEMTAEGFGMYLGLPVSGLKEVEKLAGVGDKKPGLKVNLGKVYGILDQEQYK